MTSWINPHALYGMYSPRQSRRFRSLSVQYCLTPTEKRSAINTHWAAEYGKFLHGEPWTPTANVSWCVQAILTLRRQHLRRMTTQLDQWGSNAKKNVLCGFQLPRGLESECTTFVHAFPLRRTTVSDEIGSWTSCMSCWTIGLVQVSSDTFSELAYTVRFFQRSELRFGQTELN